MSDFTQKKQIEKTIFSIMEQINSLTPHPARPDYSGPLFVKVDSAYKTPAAYDGMLGQLAMDSVLAESFMQAAAESVSEVVEGVSHYIQDRKKGTLKQSFNLNTTRAGIMKKYLADLPRRLGLERWLAYYQRKLNGFKPDCQAGLYTPSP